MGKEEDLDMRKSIIAFLTIAIIALPIFATADVLKLKSGQTYKGVVTSEEKDRVQMKLEETGTRIWFDRDQVESIKKATKKQQPKEQDEPSKSASDSGNTSAPDDDVARARELLKKMREQQMEEATGKKKYERPAPSPAENDSEQVVVPPAANGSEIDKLIDTARNGQYYDRVNAFKKLGDLKAREAIPHLIHFLDDDQYGIRLEANRSLIKITGKNFGFDPKDRGSVRLLAIEKWKDWYNEEKKKEASSSLKFLW